MKIQRHRNCYYVVCWLVKGPWPRSQRTWALGSGLGWPMFGPWSLGRNRFSDICWLERYWAHLRPGSHTSLTSKSDFFSLDKGSSWVCLVNMEPWSTSIAQSVPSGQSRENSIPKPPTLASLCQDNQGRAASPGIILGHLSSWHLASLFLPYELEADTLLTKGPAGQFLSCCCFPHTVP